MTAERSSTAPPMSAGTPSVASPSSSASARSAAGAAPATLTLTARLNGRVGMVAGVRLVAGADRQVTITLGPSASIRGKVRWRASRDSNDAHESIEVNAHAAGLPDEGADMKDDGEFAVNDLIPGMTYDLTASSGRPAKKGIRPSPETDSRIISAVR